MAGLTRVAGLDAVDDGTRLTAPSVGTWVPSVGLGAPVGPGTTLGSLVRLGRPLVVTAPKGAHGVVTALTPRGRWLQADEPLLTVGEGTLGGGAVAAVAGPAGGPAGGVAVLAETDGTVWLRPSPDAAAFATEGAPVAAQATIALVEVMKTFSPVRSPIAGRLVRIDVDDGAGVSAGQPIAWVVPESA